MKAVIKSESIDRMPIMESDTACPPEAAVESYRRDEVAVEKLRKGAAQVSRLSRNPNQVVRMATVGVWARLWPLSTSLLRSDVLQVHKHPANQLA